MKFIFLILLSMSTVFAAETEAMRPSAKNEEMTRTSNDGIDFKEWESDFDHSMQKAKVQVRKCENKSKNCQFEKFQALDPSFDMVH